MNYIVTKTPDGALLLLTRPVSGIRPLDNNPTLTIHLSIPMSRQGLTIAQAARSLGVSTSDLAACAIVKPCLDIGIDK